MDESQRFNDGAGSVSEPESEPIPMAPPPQASATGGGTTGGTGGTGETGGAPVQEAQDQMADKFQEVVEKLKPVAVAAEDAAATAVDLTAKGLGKIASYLDRRRHDRQTHDQSGEG